MALPVIVVDDFKGWAKIAANEFKAERLEEYIDLFLGQYLRRIIGSGAYADIQAQNRTKWDDLLNGVDFVDADGNRKHHNGLVKPLLYFIYFEFVRDNFTSTQTGLVIGKSANSERLQDIEVAETARLRYNKAVYLINESLECFLEANEELSSVINTSYELTGNVYLLLIESPKYLQAGESFNTEAAQYTIAEDIKNFNIDAGATGLDFAGDTAIWNFQETITESQDQEDNMYLLTVASTKGLSVGGTVTINAVDYTVETLTENVCFTIDAGATGLDFTGNTASWSFNTTISISIDLGDNTYLLAVEDASFVETGSQVTLDGTPYTILSTSDTFTIDAGATGLDFAGETINWEPYKEVEFCEIEVSGI